MEETLDYFKNLYPDQMVLDNTMTEFDRAKLAGKVDLLKEIEQHLDEVYNINPVKNKR